MRIIVYLLFIIDLSKLNLVEHVYLIQTLLHAALHDSLYVSLHFCHALVTSFGLFFTSFLPLNLPLIEELFKLSLSDVLNIEVDLVVNVGF